MSRTFGTIWRLTAGNRLMYAGAIASLVLASCFLYVAPLIPQAVIDGVIARGDESGEASSLTIGLVGLMGGREFIAANLWLPAALIALATAIAGVFTYLRARWAAGASEAIVRRVRDRVYDHLQHLPCSYFDHAETGDLVQRCTSDVETLRGFLSNQVVEIGRAMIMLLVPIPLMWMIDVRMTIASLVFVPVIVIFAAVFFTKIKSLFKQTDEAEGAMTTVIQENLTGIRVVRAFARQEFEKQKLEEKNSAHRRLDYRLYRLMAWYWSSSDLLCFLQKAAVVGLGASLLAIGELQAGAFFFFLAAVTMFIWPVRMMGRILTDLGKALVAMGRLSEILDEPREDADEVERAMAAPVLPARLRGEIEFRDVSFAHADESPVLHGVSFRVPGGKTLGILGPSGCGKSTIINLLLRLYEADAGRISIDGIDLTTLPRAYARGRMAVVLQEPFLYSKTVRENVTMSRPSASEGEMIEATSTACIHESILEFEKGYGTLVGERGVTLSGGQRQRVAIARALLQKPAVLILDDALSAVDTETETQILSALRSRDGHHTTIVIAHRLSAVMHADQIIVLERGRIVQRGTHAQLALQEGLYRRLWEIQAAVDTEEY